MKKRLLRSLRPTRRVSRLNLARSTCPLPRRYVNMQARKNKARLLSLLKPVQEAAKVCAWLTAMVESGELYHPLRWSAAEAFQFLTDVPRLEAAGIVVRAPRAWGSGRPPRPKVRATIGGRAPSLLGKDALLDFRVELALGEERLTAAEIRALLKGSDGLQLLRGRWVEVDETSSSNFSTDSKKIETAAAAGGLPFADAMRLVAGVAVEDEQWADTSDADWGDGERRAVARGDSEGPAQPRWARPRRAGAGASRHTAALISTPVSVGSTCCTVSDWRLSGG